MPPAHTRVQVQGNLLQATGGGQDIFEFGWADSSGLTPEALATLLAPVIHTAWTDPALDLGISLLAQLTGVRVEDVEANGHVSNSFYVGVTPIVGNSNSFRSTILSVAVTLETDTPNDHGRTVRGRFFPPAAPDNPSGSTYTLTDAQDYRDGWGEVLTRVNNAGGLVAVASKTGGGQVAAVTAVSVGTVVDTQRRRKNHVTVQRTARHTI